LSNIFSLVLAALALQPLRPSVGRRSLSDDMTMIALDDDETPSRLTAPASQSHHSGTQLTRSHVCFAFMAAIAVASCGARMRCSAKPRASTVVTANISGTINTAVVPSPTFSVLDDKALRSRILP